MMAPKNNRYETGKIVAALETLSKRFDTMDEFIASVTEWQRAIEARVAVTERDAMVNKEEICSLRKSDKTLGIIQACFTVVVGALVAIFGMFK